MWRWTHAVPAHNLRGDMDADAPLPSPVAPSTALPGLPLDRERWAALLDTAGPQDAGWLIRQIMADLDRMQGELMDALAQQEPAAIRRANHALIGLGGTIGAQDLHEAALALNLAVHRGEVVPLGPLGAVVLDRLAAVRVEIIRHLAALDRA